MFGFINFFNLIVSVDIQFFSDLLGDLKERNYVENENIKSKIQPVF